MKKLVLLILLISSFIGCKKVDDSAITCTTNCTTLSGKFVSLNNEPVSNVNVLLTYEISGGFFGGGSSRKIVNVRSDKNGNFEKRFYINDSELGNGKGYFKFVVDDSNLDVRKYIRQDNLTGSKRIISCDISTIRRRDTVINNTFYIPKKVFIKVNLNNFEPKIDGDFFKLETLYPFGSFVGSNAFLDSPYGTGSSGWGAFSATGANTSLNIFVAEGENNVIRVLKRKNGLGKYEDFRMKIPINNSITLNYDY